MHFADTEGVDPCLTNPLATPDDLIIAERIQAGKDVVYKAANSPGKGIGLFATQFIPKGSHILAEKTVLTCPTQGRLDARDLQNIFDQVCALSASLQNGILSLSGKVPMLSPKSSLMVYYRALLRQDVHHPDGSRLSWREVSKLQKVLKVFYTNAAAIYQGTSTRWFWQQRAVGDGLFLTFSRMNHSCEPNADWDTYYGPGVMIVWAKGDIRADEEITISYIGKLHEPVEARRKRLAQWGFNCTCVKCCPLPRRLEELEAKTK